MTELRADGSFSWETNPAWLQSRYDNSTVMCSSNHPEKVRKVQEIKDLHSSFEKDTSVKSAQEQYAQKMYLFASGEASHEPKDAKGEIPPVVSHSDSKAFTLDVSQFNSFDPSSVELEFVEAVDSPFKQFGGRCMILKNALTKPECRYLIEQMDKDMEQVRYRHDYRRNDRIVYDSPALTELLWRRVQPFCSGLSVCVDADPSKQRLLSEEAGVCPHDLRAGFGKEGVWHPSGLNECLRFCKYNPGDFFRKHCDGCFVRSEDEQSLFTCMFYLNGGFDGGATRFLGPSSSDITDIASQFKLADDSEVLASVAPEPGMCMLFFQPGLLHEGEDLRSGLKYILRTDVMYRRDPATKVPRTMQQAKAMDLVQQAQAAEERRECDLACSLYRRAFKLDPNIEQMLR